MSQVSSTNVFNVVGVTREIAVFDTFVSNRYIFTTADGGEISIDAFSAQALQVVELPARNHRKTVTVSVSDAVAEAS